MRDTALGDSLPAVLTAVVRGYLDGDWVVLLSSQGRWPGDAISLFAASTFERWDELLVVAEPLEDSRCVCRRMEAQLNARITDEVAIVDERLATKGPWTQLGDFCTPRARVEATVCVRGELVVYGGTRPTGDSNGDIVHDGDGDHKKCVDAAERLSLSDGRWRAATHARDGGEYAAAYASVAGSRSAHDVPPATRSAYAVATATLTALAPKGDPLHECVRLYYATAQCLSFGEGRAVGARVHRGPATGAAVMAAMVLPSPATLFSVCRLERAAGDAVVALTSVRGITTLQGADGGDLFHYLLDEETGRRTVAAASAQRFGCTVALPSGEMLVVGGVGDAQDTYQGHVEIYSPATDAWRPARWAVPNHRPDHLLRAHPPVGDALLAGGLLHVLFERHILIARLDPTDAAAPVEWRMMHLPYGMWRGALVRITPDQYNCC